MFCCTLPGLRAINLLRLRTLATPPWATNLHYPHIGYIRCFAKLIDNTSPCRIMRILFRELGLLQEIEAGKNGLLFSQWGWALVFPRLQ